MRRRTVLLCAAASIAAPIWARAQARKVWRLGWLAIADEAAAKLMVDGAFLVGMRELGWDVGRNLVVDIRFARSDVTRLPALADELIALKPDVLLGIETPCRVMAGKTSTIPIVMIAGFDPVAAGLAKSLSRPGGNVTGMSNLLLVAKHVELLGELLPGLTRVVLINDASYSGRDNFERVARDAAISKKLAFSAVNAIPTPDGIRAAFNKIGNPRGAGVVVAGTGAFMLVGGEIAQEASRLRLPTVSSNSQFVTAGGLIGYGANLLESYRKEVAPIVDRILKGAKPAEIPFQQSSIFEMTINRKVAKELGLSIPKTVLFRADRVIE